MAHFAKLGSNGKVIQVLTLDNKDMLNADGVEDESVGQWPVYTVPREAPLHSGVE